MKLRLYAALAAFFAVGPLSAQILGTSARQMPRGSWRLLTYYQGTEDQALNFSVRGGDGCVSKQGAGAVAFPCSQASDVPVDGSGEAAVAKLIFQPWESFQYYAAFGVGDYSVRVPSTTLTNKLTGDKPGGFYTAGLKALIVPDTAVTPAVAADFSYTRSRYYFNRRFPGGTPGLNNNINQRLDLTEWQVAVTASHLFTIVQPERLDLPVVKGGIRLEPYGGVKWNYVWADIKDLIDGSHAGGYKSSARPFFGLRVPVYEREGLFAEASFVDGTQFAGGLEIRFY